MGDKFNLPQFYVEGYDGSNVGREGGGGRSVCCVMLPRKWRPGLSVEVCLAIDDFTREKPAEVALGNFGSVVGVGTYIAQVPIEQYEVVEPLWVNFFASNKARAVSSSIGSWGSKHPTHDNDPYAIDSASPGRSVNALSSLVELAEVNHRAEKRKKELGDWR